MAQIQFDSLHTTAVYNYIHGNGADLDAAFNFPGSERLENLYIFLNSKDSIGAHSIDTFKNRRIALLAGLPPFYYASDSGAITIMMRTADTVAGSFSARMIGEDSSLHHLSGTFVAVSAPQNPG